VSDIRRRLFLGGLPEALLAERKEPQFYTEWLDSCFARDIQELFRVDKRQGFLQTAETLFRQSGSLFEATSVAKHVGISRPTVMNYLEILQVTHLLTLLRPFHGGGRQELVRQPKAYGFDTGFVSFYRGWNELRQEDLGPLWEHLILDELRAQLPQRQIHFWRDKQGHEVDFVLDRGQGVIDVVECKWNPDAFESKPLEVFRSQYAIGTNYIVSPQVTRRYERTVKGLTRVFCGGDLRFDTP
jgi:predicted AAA+ superfamily ATPase